MGNFKIQTFILSLLLLVSATVKAEDVTVALTNGMMASTTQEAFNQALGIDLSGKSDVNLVFTLDESADAKNLTDQVLGFMSQYAKSNYGQVSGFDMSALTSIETLPSRMFDGADKLKTIKLPALESLSDNLFTNCKDLTSLTIGEWSNTEGNEGLEMAVIPSGCFQNCGNLKDLFFNNVTDIKGWAFEGCTSMTAFPIKSIKEGAKVEIGTNAFANTGLHDNLNLPEGIVKVNANSFATNEKLEIIRFPKSIESVDPEFDTHDTNLKSIIIDGGDTETAITNDKNTYLTYKGILYSINGGNLAVVCCPIANPEPIVIPATIPTTNKDYNVTEIADKAFHDCAMKAITLSDGLLKIGNSAFVNCKNLTSLVIPNTVTDIATDFVNDCPALAVLKVEDGNKNYYTVNNVTYTKGTKDGDTQYYNIFRIPENADITNGVLDLSTINDAEHVTGVGSNAFYKVKNAKTIKLPDAITTLADECFKGCGLETFYVPKSLTEDGFGLAPFSECNNLTNFAPPSGKPEDELDNFYIDNYGILYNKDHDKLFKVPNNYQVQLNKDQVFNIFHNIKEVQACAFEGVKNIKTVNFPQGIKKIPHRCFYNSGSVENVLIPNSVTEIGQDAFMGSQVKNVIMLTTTETAPKSQNGNYNSFYGFNGKIHLSESSEYGNFTNKWIEASQTFRDPNNSTASKDGTAPQEDKPLSDTEKASRDYGWYGLSENNRLEENIKHRAIFENSDVIAGFNGANDIPIINDKDKANTLNAQHYDYITIYRDFSGMGDNDYSTLALPVDVTKATFIDAFGANSKVWEFTGRINKVLHFKTVDLSTLNDGDLVIKKGVAILIQPEYKENSYLLKMNLGGDETAINAIALAGNQETSYDTDDKEIKQTDHNFNWVNGEYKEDVTFEYGFYATYQKKSFMPKGSYYMLSDGSFKYAVNSLWTKGLRGFVHGNDEETGNDKNSQADAKPYFDTFITGIGEVAFDNPDNKAYNIYNINGQLVRKNATSTEGLSQGIYIMNGKKVIVK